ncbi:hypothetical protein MML48_2g00000585 [Holotrichia oblita]|uniref:Uncharacterized protein n=1 Tax=Holotrichia oblita TaxID=644536 RepID=A0ACB9TID6_HOLOL|nr:hypothetical protein MML48_2g00000585 [Holotrichia oblita]
MPGENFDTYLGELKKLAANCNFSQIRDQLIKDRIICGICETKIKDRLLREKDTNGGANTTTDGENQVIGTWNEIKDEKSESSTHKWKEDTRNGNARGAIMKERWSTTRIPKDIAAFVPNDWGLAASDSGWMKREIFYEYVGNIFYPFVLSLNIQFPVILFVDGHKTHLDRKFSNHINCTLPKCYANIAASQYIITKGFRACGLCPWNPDALDYSKCLGKNKSSLASDIRLTPSLPYGAFEKIVGQDKIERFKILKRHEWEDENFLALYNIWKAFHVEEPADEVVIAKNDEFMPVIIESTLPECNSKNDLQTEQFDDVLLNHLYYSKTPERNGVRKIERVPFVMTSSTWKELKDKKEQEKDEQLKQKENRKRERETKKLLRESEKEMKKTNNSLTDLET